MGRKWLGVTVAVLWMLCGCTHSGKPAATVAQESAIASPELCPAALTFPVTFQDSPLIVEELLCYQGPYWEDGSGDHVDNVAGLMLYNPTDRMMEFVAVAIGQGGEQRYFFAYRLPPDSRCLVLEHDKKVCDPKLVTECRQLSVRWGNQEFSRTQIDYVGFGPSMTVINRDTRQLDHVTVWYKQYVKSGDYYLGGKAYSAHLFLLQPEERRTLQPEHYHAGHARIVGIELK